MEAAPKLPLISFKQKVSPNPTIFSHSLKKYIRNFYNEDPEAYNKEIRELETLRQSVCRVQMDFTGCSTLKKYYAQLLLLESRFPMESGGAAAVVFSWEDSFNDGALWEFDNIKFEQACILYNIGALHSELGAMDSRQSSEGMKISCTHFQCAAWAFQHLRDEHTEAPSPDRSYDLLTFYIAVMLGQAQECILEKSMLDNRKSTIVAKIAAQIVDYYKQALKTLDNGGKTADTSHIGILVKAKLYKYWKKYLEFKISYHYCVTYLYMGNQAEELQKMGERVAYFQGALDKLNDVIKLSKGFEKDLSDALGFTMDVVGGKFNAATKENEFVYHEKVPPLDSLPEVKGASLVKGIPFDPSDPEVSGQDIFARLVPMEAHEASSLYSEEKAKLLRKINAAIDEKDQELMVYMSSLQLDQLRLTPEPNILPQELVDCCAALSVRPHAVKELVTAMHNLSSIYHDVDGLLQETTALLEEDEKQEKEVQAITGKRPPSMILLDIKKELAKYLEAHQKASESNVNLHKAMNYHIANLNLLSGPLDELMKLVPSVGLLDAPNDEGTGKELKRLINKVDEMKNQRLVLKNQLREYIQGDDITTLLVTKEDKNLQDLFAQELKKHDRQVGLINQNLTAQTSILKALTEANANYADTRRASNEILIRREAMIHGLIASYEAYEDLVSKSHKGLEFYRKLEGSVSKLLQRAKSVCKVQEEERMTLTEKQLKKVVTPQSLTTPKPSGSAGPKLKDYLQYMKPGSGGSNAHSMGMTAGTDVGISTEFLAPGMTTGQMPSVLPHVDSRTTPASSNFYHAPAGIPYHETELPSLPTEMRPAPVGSEQTDLPPSFCSLPAKYPESSKVTSLEDYARKSQYNYGYDLSSSGTGQVVAKQAETRSQDNQLRTPLHSYDRRGELPAVQQQYFDERFPPSNTLPTTTTGSIYAPANATQTFSPNLQPPTHQTADISPAMSQASLAPMWQPGSQREISHYPASSSVYTSNYQNYPGYQEVSNAAVSMDNSQLQTQNTNVIYMYEKNQACQPNNYSASGYRASSPYIGTPSSVQTTATQGHAISNMYSYQTPAANVAYPPQAMSPFAASQPGYSAYAQSVSSESHYLNQSASYSYTAGQIYQPTYSAMSEVSTVSYSTDTSSSTQQQSSGGLSSYTNSQVNPVMQMTNFSMSSVNQQQPLYAYQSVTNPVQPVFQDQSIQNSYLPLQQPLQPQTTGTVTSTYTHPQSDNALTTMPSAQEHPASSSQNPIPQQKVTPSSNLDLLQQLDFSSPGLNVQVVNQPNALTVNSDGSRNREKDFLSEDPVMQLTSGQQDLQILKPQVFTVSDLMHQKKKKEDDIKKIASKDPFTDKEVLDKFVADVERFQRVVEWLSKQSLKGPTPLEQKWKELMDMQDRESRKLSISVARCCAMKNRVPDIMPYDCSRVVITTLKDDYINASHIKDLSRNTAHYIATQAPLPSTYRDFWVMIYEYQIEVIAAVIGDAELKGDIYWPTEKGQVVDHDVLFLSLKSTKTKAWGIERLIVITQRETRNSRAVMHLQFTGWPPGGIPNSPAQFLQFVTDVHGFHREQRSSGRPVVVHCSAGVGRTGVFCLVSAAIHEINAGSGIIDLWSLASSITQMRKYIMQDKEHMKFCFHAVLYYAEDCLLKRGILIKRASFEDKVATGTSHKSSHTRHPSQDFILGPAHDEQIVSGTETNPKQSPTTSTVTQPPPPSSQPSTQSREDSTKDTEDKEKSVVLPEVATSTIRDYSNPTSSVASGASTAIDDQESQDSSTAPTLIHLPPNLANLDAAHFTLEPVTRKAKKITKDNFLNSNINSRIGDVDPNDPLSQLDPLWSLNK